MYEYAPDRVVTEVPPLPELETLSELNIKKEYFKFVAKFGKA